MTPETLSASGLIEKQLAEQAQFLWEQSRRLQHAGFDWKVPDKYGHWNDDISYKGLVVEENRTRSRSCATILTPKGEVLFLEKGQGLIGRCSPEAIMSASSTGFLKRVEAQVTTQVEKLNRRRAKKVS